MEAVGPRGAARVIRRRGGPSRGGIAPPVELARCEAPVIGSRCRRQRVGVATAVILMALACTSIRTVAAAAPTPPPDFTSHVVVSGPSELWLSPSGQTALPDPHQPLCTFRSSATFQQTGYDADGYDTFLWSNWGNWMSCQLRTQQLVVWDDLYDPWWHTQAGYGDPKHHLQHASNSCDSACGANQTITARLPNYNCNPCHVSGPEFYTFTPEYEMDSWFTIKFEQPLVNTVMWADHGDQWPLSDDQNCNTGEAPPGGPEIERGDLYTMTCMQEVLVIVGWTAKDGPVNGTCTMDGYHPADCRAVDPMSSPSATVPAGSPRDLAAASGAALLGAWLVRLRRRGSRGRPAT